MNHLLPIRQVKLHISKALVQRLAGLDDKTYGRFMGAKQFAESGLIPFYSHTSIGLHPVPIFDGILLLIKFHQKSELFYIADFVDWGEDPPPNSGHFIHWAKRNGLSEILIHIGLRPEFVLTVANFDPMRGNDEVVSTGDFSCSEPGAVPELFELLRNNDGGGSFRATIRQPGMMPDLALSHSRAGTRSASWGEALTEHLPALTGDGTFPS